MRPHPDPIAISGANGLLGAHLAAALRARGEPVVGLHRPGADLGRLRRLAPGVDARPVHYGVPASAAGALEDCRALVHLAWPTEPGQYLGAPDNLEALTWSSHLLAGSIEAGIPRVVTAGTCLEYGRTDQIRRERDPLGAPGSLYAATKQLLGLIAAQQCQAAGQSHAHARIFHVYGPEEDPRWLVPAMAARLRRGEPFEATEGRSERDFLHAADIGRALAAIVTSDLTGPVNVCAGRPRRVADLLRAVAERVGRPELLLLGARPTPPTEEPRIVGDPSRLRGLGWQPRFTLEQGVADTVSPDAPPELVPA